MLHILFTNKHFGQENESAHIGEKKHSGKIIFTCSSQALISAACYAGRASSMLSQTHSLKGKRNLSEEETASIPESSSQLQRPCLKTKMSKGWGSLSHSMMTHHFSCISDNCLCKWILLILIPWPLIELWNGYHSEAGFISKRRNR